MLPLSEKGFGALERLWRNTITPEELMKIRRVRRRMRKLAQAALEVREKQAAELFKEDR